MGKSIQGFLMLIILVLAVIFTMENINHRFWLNDFKVYYEAAKALRSGEDVYGSLFSLGSGFYKYSPFTLILFMPFTFLTYQAAAIVQYIILSSAIISCFLICKKILAEFYFPAEINKQFLWLIIGFICCANHFVRELHLGNINIVLLVLLCLSLWAILDNRYIIGGFLLALVVITKPFFGLLLLPLLLRRQFKSILAFILSMFWFLTGPALIVGVSENINLHQKWLETMLSHNDGFPSSNTLEQILKTYLPIHQGIHFGLILLISIVILLATGIILNLVREQKTDELPARNFIAEWFILIAMIPLLFKTDTQHFLLSLPVILILTGHLFQTRQTFPAIFSTLALILFGINSTDLLGHKLSDQFNTYGILGISNLLIIFLFLIAKRKSEEQSLISQ